MNRIHAAILALTILGAASAARARELSQADLRVIENINQTRNRENYATVRKGLDGLCAIFATEKASDLIDAGFGKGEVRLALVITERGERHEVAEVIGTLKGKPVTVVLDTRTQFSAERKDLEALGYTWLAEFSL